MEVFAPDSYPATHKSILNAAASLNGKAPQEWSSLWRSLLPRADPLDPCVTSRHDSAVGDNSAGKEDGLQGFESEGLSTLSSRFNVGEPHLVARSSASNALSTSVSQPIEPPEFTEEIPEELKDMFQDAVTLFREGGSHAVGRDRTMLYAGPPNMATLSKRYARRNGLIHFEDYSAQLDKVHADYAESGEGYSELLSAAIGRTARGDVKLMCPATGLNGYGYFTDSEWPEMVKNGRATTVTWIDPANTANQLIIWKASQGSIEFPINTPISIMALETAAHS